MAIILNSSNFSGVMARVYENSSEFVINGQAYDKNTFLPKPMRFNPISTVYNSIYFNKQLPLRNKDRYNDYIDNCLVMDQNNRDVSYLFATDNIDHDIYKIDASKNTNAKLTRGYTTPANWSGHTYIYQDSRFIYSMLFTKISTGSTALAKTDKETGVSTYSNIFANSHSNYLFEYAGSLYFACSGNTNFFSIVKYDLITGSFTTVLTDNGSVASTASFRLNVSVNKDNYSFYVARHDKGFGGKDIMIIKRYVLNTDNLTFSHIVTSIDFTNVRISELPAYNVNQHLNTISLYEFTSNKNEEFIIMTSHNYLGNIFLFKKISANNLALNQVYEIDPGVYSLMFSNENKNIIAASSFDIKFIYFNELAEKLELANSISKAAVNIGIDRNSGLWIEYADSSIEYATNSMPISVNVEFEKGIYRKDFNDVETYANVYAISSNGNMVQTEITLSIYGNAVFTSNSLKTIKVITSDIAVIKVPITIKGKGEIKIFHDK